MLNRLLSAVVIATVVLSAISQAAEFDFYGRSGDAIELNLGALPGVPSGASFTNLSLGGFAGHTVLTSSQLNQGAFPSDGRLWVFANPLRDTGGFGDTNLDAEGFQGVLEGSVDVNGQTKSFSVTVQPGHTGAGLGSVQQSSERLNRSANNPLFVAQQQHRLKYFGFVREGGLPIDVTGVFDSATHQALQTFQAAFDGAVNGTQGNSPEADGIVGPNTAAWLNAPNAPRWLELIDPDPQFPGTFSVPNMIGNFDILPARDPRSGQRTGLTPQTERFGTSWAIELFEKGSALAKLTTGITQLMNGMSTVDGYGSSAFHSTHLVGMDIDLHVDYSTWNFGNGVVSTAEQQMIDQALAFIDAPGTTGVLRILTSNQDILNGINALRPGKAAFDSSGGHRNHFHVDVRAPARQTGVANLTGDFNLDGVVNALDYTVWRDGLGATRSAGEYNTWANAYAGPRAASSVPEPTAALLLLSAFALAGGSRRRV